MFLIYGFGIMSFVPAILIFPFVLTVLNIKFICGKEDMLFEKRQGYTKVTLVSGLILFNSAMYFMSGRIWDDPDAIRSEGILFHPLFSSDFYFIFLILEIVSVISIILLDRPKIMSPVSAVMCVCGTFAGFIIFMLYAGENFRIALHDNNYFFLFYMWIYILNFYLCTARVLREAIRDYIKYFRQSDMSVRSEISCNLAKTLSTPSGWFKWASISLIPLFELIVALSFIR